jgi:exopolyphosphatase / guanosine-5'-triphosphate,3'-diphosphate pyrophosphatase
MTRISVIDLGTNTFNLLIVETGDELAYNIIYNSKLPVKLGKSGIDKKEIRPDAITRGMNALDRHLTTIREYGSEKIYAFATSGIRSARNGEQFVKMIQQRFGIDVEIISGDREAEFIYHGVKQAVKLTDEKVLILDIGGGSNEFIIADRTTIYWKKSYPLGVARLLAKFKPSDPISIEEIEFISNYLEERLSDLFEEFRKHKITTMVGASGSFETIAAMIRAEESVFESETAKAPESVNIDLTDFENLYQRLINSTLKERKQMKGLESMRLEMIVIATLIVKFILQKLKINRLVQSNFSLKEGVVHEILNMKTVLL